MSTSTKSFLAFAVVGAVAGLVAFFGLSPFGKEVVQQIAGSSTGTTFNTAKVAAVVMSPTTSSATSTSILNTDASDRIILDNFVSCAGATTTAFGADSLGLATWKWGAATTSGAAPQPSILNSVNAAMNINVATGTYDAYTASSTYTAVYTRRWAAGSYLTFQTNGTTTPSLSCVAGVHYIGS